MEQIISELRDKLIIADYVIENLVPENFDLNKIATYESKVSHQKIKKKSK